MRIKCISFFCSLLCCLFFILTFSCKMNGTESHPDPMELKLIPTHVSVSGGSDGSIDLTVTGGTDPFYYEWSNGENTQDVNNLTVGLYSVVVTDAQAKTITDSVKVTLKQKIVFASDRSNIKQIYIMNIDGSNQVRLTHDSNRYRYPIFSPDGLKIIFNSYTYDDSDEIYMMNIDGTELVNLSQSPGDDNLPSFSPDGKHIIFTSTRDGNREIYIMSSDGEHQTRLTSNDIIDHSPQFIADSQLILYFTSDPADIQNNIYNIYNIYIMDIDGNNKKCLTNNDLYFITHVFTAKSSFNVFDAMPCISPDGSNIVFSSYDNEQKNYFISVIDIDGLKKNILTYEIGTYDLAPLYTPDGNNIIFRSHRGANYDLYKMSLEGQNLINLTNGSGHAYFSQFSPDGSKILFNTDRDMYYKIWIMDQDGLNQKQLTSGDYNDYYPRFQPISMND